MHETEEQKRKRREALVRAKFNEIVSRKDEIADIGRTAQTIWYSLLKCKTFSIVEGPKPRGPWDEPEEIWSETPVVHR